MGYHNFKKISQYWIDSQFYKKKIILLFAKYKKNKGLKLKFR